MLGPDLSRILFSQTRRSVRYQATDMDKWNWAIAIMPIAPRSDQYNDGGRRNISARRNASLSCLCRSRQRHPASRLILPSSFCCDRVTLNGQEGGAPDEEHQMKVDPGSFDSGRPGCRRTNWRNQIWHPRRDAETGTTKDTRRHDAGLKV